MKYFDFRSTKAMIALCIVICCIHQCSGLSFGTSRSTACFHASTKALSSATVPRIAESEQVSKVSTNLLDGIPDVLLPIYPAVSTSKPDGIWEKIAIFLLSWSLACVSVDKYDAMKYVRPGMGYQGFVSVTRTLLKGTAEDIRVKVVDVLLSLVPMEVRPKIYAFCQEKPRWIAEKSSEFMSFGLLGWLVGPLERVVVNVPQADGSTEEWLSGVKIAECRYLVESGCKSACLHLCKGPTQSFFNDHLGLKVHMKPDFKDCSCEMLFGIAPPAVDADPAYGEPCFSTCSMNAMKQSKAKKNKVKQPGSDGDFNKCS